MWSSLCAELFTFCAHFAWCMCIHFEFCWAVSYWTCDQHGYYLNSTWIVCKSQLKKVRFYKQCGCYFRDVKQHTSVVDHRCFGTAYWSHFQMTSSDSLWTSWPLKKELLGCLETLVIYKPMPLHTGRVKVSSLWQQKPEI